MRKTMRSVVIIAVFGIATSVVEAQGPQSVGPNGNQPFSSIYRRPSVSPYLQIQNFANNPIATANIYQSLIVPQQQQQQAAVQQLQQGRQLNRLQGQVQQMQRTGSQVQQQAAIRPTGHSATFQNLSHFYPGAR